MKYRFSGQETFPCRYTWLPKVVQHVAGRPNIFADEDDAIVRFGVGKNMVKAIRFWAEVSGVAEEHGSNHSSRELGITTLGNKVFGDEGHDEYLEDIRTLWLIHWKLCSNYQYPIYTWHFMLNFWHRNDFTLSEAHSFLMEEASRFERKPSKATLDNQLNTFLHTYVPTRGNKQQVVEDNLDSPLIELELIQKTGVRTMADSNRTESVYSFRVEKKPEINAGVFAYSLSDYWNNCFPDEQTLSFRSIAVGECSPGQVFKLPEQDIRARLESLERDTAGALVYQESASLQQIVRKRSLVEEESIELIYQESA